MMNHDVAKVVPGSSLFPSRREALGALAALGCFGPAAAAPAYQLATFTAEVTPPLGHPLMGGGVAPAQKIDDPLFATGFVLSGDLKPVVLVSVDWCEIRNEAHDRWRAVLAEAAGTTPERVLVTAIHQHDAPLVDLEAQRLLEEHKATINLCNRDFHEEAVQRVARAVRAAVRAPRRITHFGVGQAQVDRVASNRRYLDGEGKPRFNRMSATRDAALRDKPDGIIDPWLKTLSFWDGEQALTALSVYATHPMSYYGKGGVSADFVGLARKRRQADEPGVVQLYASGCSGNVTAGKYNEGRPDQRPVLAERMYQAMQSAWKATKRLPLGTVQFRSVPYHLKPRDSAGFTAADLQQRLTTDPRPFGRCLAALGLSWQKRTAAGRPLDLPVLDLGQAVVVLLPGETYVEYQLFAQQLRPAAAVFALGYGECAPGYVPTEKHFAEGDSNLSDWCWVAPGCEQTLHDTLRKGLLP